MTVTMQITGLEEMRAKLADMAPREARNLLRSTVHGTATEIRNRLRQRVPKDTRTLEKAIVSKRRRGKPDEIVSDVIIEHGRGARRNAFYWHIVEFGSTRAPARPFIIPTVEEISPRIPEIFRDQFGSKLAARLKRKAAAQPAVIDE